MVLILLTNGNFLYLHSIVQNNSLKFFFYRYKFDVVTAGGVGTDGGMVLMEGRSSIRGYKCVMEGKMGQYFCLNSVKWLTYVTLSCT